MPELCLAQVRLLPIQGLTVHFSRGLRARGTGDLGGRAEPDPALPARSGGQMRVQVAGLA